MIHNRILAITDHIQYTITTKKKWRIHQHPFILEPVDQQTNVMLESNLTMDTSLSTTQQSLVTVQETNTNATLGHSEASIDPTQQKEINLVQHLLIQRKLLWYRLRLILQKVKKKN